jgi:Flp pilus assembly protein TadB
MWESLILGPLAYYFIGAMGLLPETVSSNTATTKDKLTRDILGTGGSSLISAIITWVLDNPILAILVIIVLVLLLRMIFRKIF